MATTQATADAPAGELAPAPARADVEAVPAFRAVYDRYFKFVWAAARHLGVPVVAHDDVVREVFVVAHSRLGTVERPESLRSWLYVVVRRISTYRRARSTRAAREWPNSEQDDIAVLSQSSPLYIALLSDEVQLLAELTLAQRALRILAEIEEMPVAEIAEVIGIPVTPPIRGSASRGRSSTKPAHAIPPVTECVVDHA